MKELSRRDFLRLAAMGAGALAAGTILPGCGRSVPKLPAMGRRKTLVLGFDGMDARIVRGLIDAGHLPNLAKLAQMGDFRVLRSSDPPQSPVAWASFITGMDPGGHHIFDFIHRDPRSYGPMLSTSSTQPADRVLKLGDYRLPLGGGEIELHRRGRAFWNVMADHDVPATIYRIPANFPPEPSTQRTISDLGTPDLRGGYGHFCIFTEDDPADYGEVTGGTVFRVDAKDGFVDGSIPGPENSFRASEDYSEVSFRAWIDRSNPVVRIDIEGQRVLLREGEWSRWIEVRFRFVSGVSVSGICRFYLKSTHPLRLYATPVNIDPARPALPISTPDDYAAELQRATGSFYTQGMAEDTKALSEGVFDDDEFIAQARLVQQERVAAFEYELDRFEDGLLFAYFSASDLPVHMFYRAIDPLSPLYTPELAEKHGEIMLRIYSSLDNVLATGMAAVGDDALVMVMSDHGFAPYRRYFDLNNWLTREGYLRLDEGEGPALDRADWARSRAYAMGFNGLYVNEVGREAEGAVSPGPAKRNLLEELEGRLAEVRDPVTGERIIRRIHRSEDYLDRPDGNVAPDLILGYESGYRGSWESAIGEAAVEMHADNMDRWSGDHCMDSETVPGVLFCNREIEAEAPGLVDLAPTILQHYGITPPREMRGTPVLRRG